MPRLWLPIAVLLAGCGRCGFAAQPSRSHFSTLQAAAWAEDGSAFITCRFERDVVDDPRSWGLDTGYHLENRRSRLEVSTRSGSVGAVAELPGDRCGNRVPFHFMRAAGYAIVDDLQVPLDGGKPRRIAVEREDLAGGRLVPSPDGRVIAALSYPNHGAQQRAGRSPAAYVTFFDARNGSILGGPHRLPWARPAMTWTPAGELIVADRVPPAPGVPVRRAMAARAGNAIRVEIDGRLVPAPSPPCFNPPTSSSAISATGEVLRIAAGELTIGPGSEPSFGCRLSPAADPEYEFQSGRGPGYVSPLAPASMRRIGGGSYPAERWLVGRFELGEGRVSLQPFLLDETPVTVGAFWDCVRKNRCRAPELTVEWPGIDPQVRSARSTDCNEDRPELQDHPMNCVDWRQAAQYCAVAGGRLPTAEELEWAAHAAEKQWPYPWGHAAPGDRVCWSDFHGTCPVGSHPRGKSPQQVRDLVGSVSHWTSSAPFWDRHVPDPLGPRRYWVYGELRKDARSGAEIVGDLLTPEERRGTVGFRCAR